jgi:toxin CptA
MHEIECKPSTALAVLLGGLGALALTAVWTAALPPGWQAALSLGVAAAVAPRLFAAPPARLRLRADGTLQWQVAGDWQEAEVLGDSLASQRLIVLRARVAGRVRTQVLLPDSADADDLRRLRVALRWTRRTRSGTSFPDAG